MNAPPLSELTTLMSTGLTVVDGGLRVRWLNPALGELLEVGPRKAVGQVITQLIREPSLGGQATRALAEQRPLHLRGLLVDVARGRELLVDISLQPLPEERLLIEVHALAPEGSAWSTPLSATLRGFAHEVKNPLAGLRGAAQLLERRVGESDLKQLASMVIAEADRLAKLADGLLRHGGAAHIAPLNVHELLERLSALVEAQVDSPRVRHDYDPSLPDIVGDADRLLQVLLNLTRNASEAGARCIVLRTRVEHGARVGERTVRRALRVDVIDDGGGVSDELRETLFQPLVSGRADGTGLGLALSREIAREHGGELRYVSRPGETVFSLYLPMDRTHE